jgi:hypothetical protein
MIYSSVLCKLPRDVLSTSKVEYSLGSDISSNKSRLIITWVLCKNNILINVDLEKKMYMDIPFE